MRLFYVDEGPIDTLLQIAARPVRDGDLVSKGCRDKFVALEWVSRCEGWNVITSAGHKVIDALALRSKIDVSALLGERQFVRSETERPANGMCDGDAAKIAEEIRKRHCT